MNIKNGIKIVITILMVILYIGFCFLHIKDAFNESYYEKSTKIVKMIEDNIRNNRRFKKISNDLHPNEYLAVWMKKDNHNWQPVIFNRKYISFNELNNPRNLPDSIKYFTIIYPNTNNKPITEKNNSYYVWLNIFHLPTWIVIVLLPTLFFLLSYIFLIFLCEIFFSSKNNPELATMIKDNETQKNIIEEQMTGDDAPTIKSESNDYETFPEILDKNKLLESYEDLWKKNFKITEIFKSNFPFDKIYNLVQIGITPNKYIKDSLEFASGYFKWNNPKFYIKQQHVFVEIETKDILDESNMIIPINGDSKGAFYIPLYPYNINSLYGYFYFEWNNNNKFEISDIIYFLKFFFSERAKNIFLNYDKLSKIIEKLENKLNQNKNISLALLEIGDKKNLEANLKPEWIDDLTKQIYERLKNHFTTDEITTFSPYLFGIIGDEQDKEKQILKLERWINDLELQLYPVAKEYGSIALTYSSGVSFLNNRNIHPISLLNEAENNLKKAIAKGRNQVVY